MEKRSRRKRKTRLKIGNILIALICVVGIVAGSIFAFDLYKKMSIPESLRDSRNKYSEVKVQIKTLRFKNKGSDVVVFYPQDNPEVDSFAKDKAETMKKYVSQFDFEGKEIRVDYRDYTIAGHYFLVYDVVDEHGRIYDIQSYSYDMGAKKEVHFNEFLTIDSYPILRDEIRYQVKESGVAGDYAYTNDFYANTQPEQLTELQGAIVEDQLIVYYLVQNQQVEVKIPLNVIASTLSIDVGVQGNEYVRRHYVNPNRPIIIFTFDDGPVNKNTHKAVELLNQYDGSGTFFMLGSLMKTYPELVKEVAMNGHEVGSHSYNHPNLTAASTDVSYQFNENQRIINDVVGIDYTIKVFRPPYGAVNQNVRDVAPYPLIMWSIDTLDWKTLDPNVTYEHIMANAQDGAIVLMHDLHAPSVESLEKSLPALVEAGYQIVSVSEGMNLSGIDMQNGKSYFTVKP